MAWPASLSRWQPRSGFLAGYVPALAAMILYGAAIVVGYLLVSFAGFTLRQYDRADRATRRHK
jgi:hypothetical protein